MTLVLEQQPGPLRRISRHIDDWPIATQILFPSDSDSNQTAAAMHD